MIQSVKAIALSSGQYSKGREVFLFGNSSRGKMLLNSRVEVSIKKLYIY